MSGDLYKDLYDAEWIRRDQLQSAVAVPVGLLTLLGGGIVLFIQKFEEPATSALVTECALLASGRCALRVIPGQRTFVQHTSVARLLDRFPNVLTRQIQRPQLSLNLGDRLDPPECIGVRCRIPRQT